MNIIAFDTSSQVLSAALLTDSGVWCTDVDAESSHSELLMECADWLCKTAGIGSRNLSGAACMKGPGSFTGLRIGFSAAKGLALALKIPLYAVPTLDCMAYHLSAWPGLVLPSLDAKKSCFFAALYSHGKRLSGDMDAEGREIARCIHEAQPCQTAPMILTGPGSELLYSVLGPYFSAEKLYIDAESRRGRARDLLEIIKSNENMPDSINSGPVYLRKSDAELKWEESQYHEKGY